MANFENNISAGIKNPDSQVSGIPLSTGVVEEAVPGLLSNAIDSMIVKVRPMATPLDQISRMGQVRSVDSMEVDYFSVDTRPDTFKIRTASAYEGADVPAGMKGFRISFSEKGALDLTDTFVKASEAATGEGSIFYVASREGDDLIVYSAGGATLSAKEGIIRMGRAATQLDVQTPQYTALPTRSTNYCQIFKMQIEQSLVLKMSHKEIGWDFTDQQESAIYDMRLGMEKQFLFGRKGKFFDQGKGENVLLTGGIWNQTEKSIGVDLQKFDSSALIDMLRAAFTDNAGSRRKVLLAGSDLIAAINKIEHTHVITARDQVTAWGIDFSELISKFGRLYVVYSDVFDVMGMPGNGMIIDPEYIQKHVFIPFNAETIDLRGSGQRNTEAIVLTECSCLTLRYPDAHARIVANPTA